MRTTLNVSMPKETKTRVDFLVKNNNYNSISELFRDALRALEDEKLIESIEKSQKEIALGKGKRLRSLRDLI